MKRLVLAILFVLSLNARAVDLIVHDAKILTVDDAFTVKSAMAVEKDRIVRVGSDDEVLALKTPNTRVLDLGGRTVLPGLIDSHVHPRAAMTEFDHEIAPMETVEDVLAHIRKRAKAVGEGEWISLRQIFITRLREQRYPTRAEMDEAAPKNPVVFSTGPDASLNTLALRLSGIGRDFEVKDGGAGFAEKDPKTGEPTGILRNCTRYVKSSRPRAEKSPSDEDTRRRTVELFRDYNAVGLTGVADRDASPDGIALYEKLLDRGELTVRMSISAGIGSIGKIEALQQRIRAIASNPLHRDFSGAGEMLRIVGIKNYLDGGMLTGSAYLHEPWGVSKIYGITDPQYRGVLQIPRERLLPLVRTAIDSGLQYTAHSVGDGAVHALLDVYEELNREMPEKFRAARPCITHCNFMSEEAVTQAVKLGVVADIQPIWLHMDGRTLHAHFGDARLRWFQPLKSCFAAGMTIGGGSDHMQKIGARRAVNPYDPWLGMHTAITRRARGLDAPLHPEEALTREQALRFYTINNARLLMAEKHLGSLEAGKLADFIVIDRDFMACPVDDIERIKVLQTFLGGREVFALPAGGPGR
jgi:predicted amidohydrolase YtcJ